MKKPFAEGSKESVNRRSFRLLLQVPVIIRCEGPEEFTEETQTLVVNAHGALVGLGAVVQSGQTLFLKNKITGEERACRIAYLGPPSGGKTQVGLEFIEPSPHFWQISFPPEDWARTAKRLR